MRSSFRHRGAWVGWFAIQAYRSMREIHCAGGFAFAFTYSAQEALWPPSRRSLPAELGPLHVGTIPSGAPWRTLIAALLAPLLRTPPAAGPRLAAVSGMVLRVPSDL
jgi:hypothetical protein